MKIALLLILLAFIFPKNASATAPGIDIYDCSGNIRSHGNCEEILCNWRNASNNWPAKSDYKEDCSKFTYKIINYDLIFNISLVIIIGIISGLLAKYKRNRMLMVFLISVLLISILFFFMLPLIGIPSTLSGYMRFPRQLAIILLSRLSI